MIYCHLSMMLCSHSNLVIGPKDYKPSTLVSLHPKLITFLCSIKSNTCTYTTPRNASEDLPDVFIAHDFPKYRFETS